MAACMELIRTEFPSIDDDLYRYIEGVLENGKEDFENTEEVYEAIGEVMHEIGDDKSEEDIMLLCEHLLDTLKLDKQCKNGPTKVLNAPVHLGSMAATLESNVEEIKSIWVTQRDDTLKVDQKKLEKAEAKLQQKLEKRSKDPKAPVTVSKENAASASQMLSKKDMKMEAKGSNNCKNIKIENFDVSFGDRVLLKGADLTLVFGKRYGLLGRNGLGKTTLLRMISSGQLRIPSHISILHVEQEVVGDDTIALQSVLESDSVREALLKEERELSSKANENQNAETNKRLAEVYAELQHIEADKAPARASVILAGLGFDSRRQQLPTRVFSGGWRMRLSLARALFSRPDLLLLDEPTNMLDMKAIIWLETYLQNWPTTLLVVSHDRLFLDTVPNEILHLHSQRIDCYRGNYEHFVKAKAEKLKNQQREYEAQMMYRTHVQMFIDKFRFNAKRASLVQSKIKLLEKLPELKPVEDESGVTLKFPPTEPLSPPILQLDEVSFAYEEGRPVLVKLNLNATLESRICIVGENGSGKTTLLKVLMEDLSPNSGIRHSHRNLKFGYFSQHHVDQLEMEISSVELMQAKFPGKRIEEYRRQLGSFGVIGDLALQTINSLSGGQKSRVAFAIMSMSRPNFLILDEPTNHLDIETIEALGNAINQFNGGVILVSHDERLIRMVCKELWVCAEGNVSSMDGGFDEYRRIVEKEIEAQSK